MIHQTCAECGMIHNPAILMTDARDLLLAEIQRLQLTLIEARLEIESLHEKFGETGSGNAVLARIAVVLDQK